VNRTKIEWCDYTWNPVTGCKTGCWYCFAQRMATRFHRSFEPAFHPERLNEPLRVTTPAKIFVCSTADLFGPWIEQQWQRRVFQICAAAAWHTFLFLTKWPNEMANTGETFPLDAWAGLTLTGEVPSLDARKLALFEQVEAPHFLSFEPLLGPPPDLNLWNIEWVIVGAYTGAGAKQHAPSAAWIDPILDAAARYEIPVFMKNNLRPYWPGELRQEWPEELR